MQTGEVSKDIQVVRYHLSLQLSPDLLRPFPLSRNAKRDILVGVIIRTSQSTRFHGTMEIKK